MVDRLLQRHAWPALYYLKGKPQAYTCPRLGDAILSIYLSQAELGKRQANYVKGSAKAEQESQRYVATLVPRGHKPCS